MCRLYGVTRAGFYAWQQRCASYRDIENAALLRRIKAIHEDSDSTYGSPRITSQLKQEGVKVGRHRVARLMRENQVKAKAATLYYRKSAAHNLFYASIPNRGLKALATQPNQVWVGDVTYLKVGTEWRYLAVVMDKCSRRIVGCSLGKERTVSLTLKALNQARQARRPSSGLLFHSDRGAEYGAYAYRQRLASLGIVQSMNRPGRMTDNAFMESFFHSMKADVIHGRRFESDKELRSVVRRYMSFYNEQRLHSGLNYLPPAKFEAMIG